MWVVHAKHPGEVDSSFRYYGSDTSTIRQLLDMDRRRGQMHTGDNVGGPGDAHLPTWDQWRKEHLAHLDPDHIEAVYALNALRRTVLPYAHEHIAVTRLAVDKLAAKVKDLQSQLTAVGVTPRSEPEDFNPAAAHNGGGATSPEPEEQEEVAPARD